MTIRPLIVAAAVTVALATSAAAQTVTKYVRYQAGNTTSYGILEGDTIRELQGSIFENTKPTGRTRKLAEVKLLAPVEPKKVIAAGLNYKSHAEETKLALPTVPATFTKFPACLSGPFDDIPLVGPANDWEVELVVVIGKWLMSAQAPRAANQPAA